MRRGLPFHSHAVWPPTGLVVVFVMLYGIMDIGIRLIERTMPNAREVFSESPEITAIRAAILVGAAGCYAIYRLWRFHPACYRGYAGWLKSVPWTADKPLPLGPIHPVWQDAVVLGTIAAVAKWHAHADPFVSLAVFALVYLGGMTLLLALTRTWVAFLVLGFLWPALMLPEMKGWPMTIPVVAMILVIWHGHRMSLRRFPWEHLINSTRPNSSGLLSLQIELRLPGLSNTASLNIPNVGWPYLAISPKVQFNPISIRTSFFISLLFGWWTYCVIVASEMEAIPEVILFFAVIAALFRLVIYCSTVAAPFNLRGRIVSGRIVVPGFDKVFLTPLAAVILAIGGAALIRRSVSWYPLVESIVVAVLWFLLLSGGPTLRKWLLTGQHRYRPPIILGANKQLLRSV